MVPGSVRVITRARLAELDEPTRSVPGSAGVLPMAVTTPAPSCPGMTGKSGSG